MAISHYTAWVICQRRTDPSGATELLRTPTPNLARPEITVDPKDFEKPYFTVGGRLENLEV